MSTVAWPEHAALDRSEAGKPADVVERVPVKVVVERGQERNPASVEAQLLEMSAIGAKLSTTSPLQFSESVVLKINSRELELNLVVTCVVHWVRYGPGDKWTVGCSFVTEFPQEALDRLASAGLVDRRESHRCQVASEATARCESDQKAVSTVLRDVSVGGYCLFSPEPARPGDRMLVRFRTPLGGQEEMCARIQWCVEHNNGYILGCAFANGKEPRIARHFASEVVVGSVPTVVRRLSLITIVGAAAVVLLGWLWSFLR
jgi:hypothetical protein